MKRRETRCAPSAPADLQHQACPVFRCAYPAAGKFSSSPQTTAGKNSESERACEADRTFAASPLCTPQMFLSSSGPRRLLLVRTTGNRRRLELREVRESDSIDILRGLP